MEHRLASGRIPDVFCGFAIEIFYRHAIGDEKIKILESDGVGWIELEAEPILEDPSRWEARRCGGKLKETRICSLCLRRMQKDTEDARHLANEMVVSAINRQRDLDDRETRLTASQAQNAKEISRMAAERTAFEDEMSERTDSFQKHLLEKEAARSQAIDSLGKKLAEMEETFQKYSESVSALKREHDILAPCVKEMRVERDEILASRELLQAERKEVERIKNRETKTHLWEMTDGQRDDLMALYGYARKAPYRR